MDADLGHEEARGTFRFADLTVWRQKIRGVDHAYPSPGGRRPNPLVIGDLLVAACSRPALLCVVDRATGRSRWRRRLADFLDAGSLVAVNGAIYGVGGGHLFAIDARSGHWIWRHRIGERIWTTDSEPIVGEDHLVIGDWAGVVWCLDARTGVFRWSAMPDPSEKLGVSGAALVHEGVAVVPAITGFAVGYELQTGREMWRTALDGPCADELVLFRANILLRTRGSIYLLDPNDGGIVLRWNAGGPDVRECVPAGDLVLVDTWAPRLHASGEARGDLIALRGGEVVYRRPAARWPTGLRYSSETGFVYEARQDGLGIIDPLTGDRLWDLQAGSGPLDRWCGTPDVRDRVIYALTADGRLHALRHPRAGEIGPNRRRTRPRPPVRPQPPLWAGPLPTRISPPLRGIYEASMGVRRAMDYAQAEARRLGHREIRTEHLLLGILRFGYGLAATPHELGVELDPARDVVEALAGRGTTAAGGTPTDLPLTEGAGRALTRALEVAQSLGRRSIGGEELLLGIAREKRGLAVRVLQRLGVPTGQLLLTIQLRWLPWWLSQPPVPERQDPWRPHLSQFTDQVRHVFRSAKALAAAGPPYILALEQLLITMLGENDVANLVLDAGSDVASVSTHLAAVAATTGARQPGRHGRADWIAVTARVLSAIRAGADEARQRGSSVVGIEHLLLGLIRAADQTDTVIAGRAALVTPQEAGREGVLAMVGIDPNQLQQLIEQRLG